MEYVWERIEMEYFQVALGILRRYDRFSSLIISMVNVLRKRLSRMIYEV